MSLFARILGYVAIICLIGGGVAGYTSRGQD